MNKTITRFAISALALIASITTACAQTSPGLVYGQVPTAAQWNSYFAAKQDYPGGGVIVWPTSGNLVISNGTNTPASLAPVNGSCAIGSGGVWAVGACGGGGGTPGGANTQLQYNNAGAFGGITGATTNGTIVTLTSAVFVTPALGTPASGVLTNATGLPLTTGVTGTLGAGNGGTGIASYTIGDILYASGATTLSKLADVATTNVLLSGGVGVAPSWGKVANAALSNSAMTLCGTSTSLGGTLTASACLDNIGSTQGQLLYRNAANWTILSPGTAGQLLQSGGAGANPSWVTASGTGTVTTLTAGNGVLFSSGVTCTTTCTISTTVGITAKSTGNAINSTDAGNISYANSGSSVAISIVQANTAGFTTGAGFEYANLGAGQTTITAAGGSMFGNSLGTLLVDKGQYVFFASNSVDYPITALTLPVVPSDGVMGNFTGATNYPKWAVLPSCSAASSAVTYNTTTHAFGCNTISGSGTVNSGTSGQVAYYVSTGTAVSGSNLGTGVLTAMGVNLSAAGGLTTTIATGTSALGTGAISSATCASVVTTAATNVATTDVILAGFNGDPTAVTGYTPATTGMLTIVAYPSANNVNFKVCNNTGSSITPGAITLNWRVSR